jgi:hypothetical protein
MTDILQKKCDLMEEAAKNDDYRGCSLNLHQDYMENWTFSDGLREIAQNFFDQIVKQRRLVAPEFNTNETKYEKTDNRFVFYAYSESGGKIPLGFIEINERDAKINLSRITFVNCFTALSTKILSIGATDKRKSDPLSGGFGEGLKVGINAILRQHDSRVSYITNGHKWMFTHESKSNEDLLLRVNFRTLDEKARHDYQSKTLVRIMCDLEPHAFERILRRNFLFMMPVLQGDFGAFTLNGGNKGCWTEMHFFLHPSLRVTRATMLPDASGDAERNLTGALFCRGINVTYDTSFYYGIGINLDDKSVMTRDRNMIKDRHAYLAVGQWLAKFLRQHPAHGDILKYLFDILQSLPRRESAKFLCFGDQSVEVSDGFRTVWSGLCETAMTGDKQWLAGRLLQEFRARFGESCFPCIDDAEKTEYKERGIGDGVVVSELLCKFLKAAGVIGSIEQHFEEILARAPVLDVSKDPRVILLCNRLVFAALSGPEKFDYLRTDSVTVHVGFVDRPLVESQAVFRLEQINGKTIFRVLLGNKIDILSLAMDVQRVENDTRSPTKDLRSVKLLLIAQGIRQAVTEKYKRLVNMPVPRHGGQNSSMLSLILFQLMLRDIECGLLHKTDVYLDRIESKIVASTAVAELPSPSLVAPESPNSSADDIPDGYSVVSHSDVTTEITFEQVASFDLDGQQFRIMCNKRRRIGEEVTPVAPPRSGYTSNTMVKEFLTSLKKNTPNE